MKNHVEFFIFFAGQGHSWIVERENDSICFIFSHTKKTKVAEKIDIEKSSLSYFASIFRNIWVESSANTVFSPPKEANKSNINHQKIP